MKNIFLTIIMAFGLSVATSAQIFPPDFICVNADTLIWNIPNNPCGTFNSYEIYFSDTFAGPYSLLTTVTDENQTNFYHATAGGNVWYYYILSNYNCPGEPQISSDTLDSRPPDVAVMEVASVENGAVELTWNPSPSPETVGYIIYRQTNIGVVPIDTVFGGVTYIDLDGLPNNQSETYFVNALDECGNTSVFDNPHNTILLETTVNPCEQSLLLEWNEYQNWLNPTEEHEIWLSINNDPFQQVGTADGEATDFLYENATDGDDYCFFVTAVEATTGVRSNSNVFCETLNIVEPIRELQIFNVSVTPTDEVEISYVWNTNAELSQYSVLNDESGSLIPVATENPPTPLQTNNLYLDDTASPMAGSIGYQILTTDLCDSMVVSNLGKTIFLRAESVGGTTNKLTWTPLGIDNTFSISYEIYLVENGIETLLSTATEQDSTYFDPVDVNSPEDAEICYLIIGYATVPLPDGSLTNIQSRSNIGCVAQSVRVFVPNAFSPRGVNQEFKPLVVFGEEASYEMIIYDRYGDQLFVSTNIETGWRGKIGSEDAPPGGYLYTINITQTDGTEIVRKGTLMLIR